MLGVSNSPSALRIMTLRPDSSRQAMAELVVPRSIPTAFCPLINAHPLLGYSTLSWIGGGLKPDKDSEPRGLSPRLRSVPKPPG